MSRAAGGRRRGQGRGLGARAGMEHGLAVALRGVLGSMLPRSLPNRASCASVVSGLYPRLRDLCIGRRHTPSPHNIPAPLLHDLPPHCLPPHCCPQVPVRHQARCALAGAIRAVRPPHRRRRRAAGGDPHAAAHGDAEQRGAARRRAGAVDGHAQHSRPAGAAAAPAGGRNRGVLAWRVFGSGRDRSSRSHLWFG